jgi:hypothetical protein
VTNVLQPIPEQSHLVRSGGRVVDGKGDVWFGRGLTMFLLYARFLRGEDIRPQLVWARGVSASYLRVFGPVPVPPWRSEWTFYTKPTTEGLGEFFDLLGSHGLRCEFVPVCSPWPIAVAQPYLRQCFALAGARWNVMIECTNEPGQTGTFHENLHDLIDPIERHGVLSATGVAYRLNDRDARAVLGIPRMQHFWQAHWLDYGTIHLPRDHGFATNAPALGNWRDGEGETEGSGRAAWDDEPYRVDEGRTFPGLEDFVSHFAFAGICGGASLVHFDVGREANIPAAGSLEDRVIRETSRIWHFIPAIATTGRYVTGNSEDFPLEWKPEDSTVGYAGASWVGEVGWCVNSLPPAGWKAKPKPGITIVDEGPRSWILKVRRSGGD